MKKERKKERKSKHCEREERREWRGGDRARYTLTIIYCAYLFTKYLYQRRTNRYTNYETLLATFDNKITYKISMNLKFYIQRIFLAGNLTKNWTTCFLTRASNFLNFLPPSLRKFDRSVQIIPFGIFIYTWRAKFSVGDLPKEGERRRVSPHIREVRV